MRLKHNIFFQWKSMKIHWLLLMSMKVDRYLWKKILHFNLTVHVVHGSPWNAMNIHGFPRPFSGGCAWREIKNWLSNIFYFFLWHARKTKVFFFYKKFLNTMQFVFRKDVTLPMWVSNQILLLIFSLRRGKKYPVGPRRPKTILNIAFSI